MITGAMSATATSVEPPREKAVSSQKLPIPNIAGKNLVATVIEYQPGAKSPAHRHPNSNLVYAHVMSGAIRSQLNDGPPKVYKAGESWFELPGVHHKISENASDTESARLLVIFIADADGRIVFLPDP
jgi:quercetin dioxygenase-like cupin family protein